MAVDDEIVDPRAHPDFPESAAPAPRANPELVGHGEAERRLATASGDGTIAGAWLIGGPEGIGKATLAYRVGRHLLAGGGNYLFGDVGDMLAMDAADPVFGRIAGGAHGDLMTIEIGFDKQGKKRTEIVVEDIRRVEPFFHQSAGEGGWRVAVIDGAERMNRNAANAALKLIEEPPRRSVVLLVSHAPARLLPTIRSRCRKLHLHPLEGEQIALLLEQYLPQLSEADRLPLARLSEGSIGRAMQLDALGGLDLYRELIAMVGAEPRMDPAVLHAMADKLGRYGQDAACRTALDLLGAWLARLVRGGTGAQMTGEPVLADEPEIMARLTGSGNLDRWVDVWEKVARLRDRADSLNLDRKQVVLAAFGAVETAARS